MTHRARFAVLVLLAVALTRVSDSHEETTGGRKEGAGADQVVWDQQQQSRGIIQGQSSSDHQDGTSRKTSSEASTGSRDLARTPRAASAAEDPKHVPKAGPAPAAAGASREVVVSAPRDGAQRSARHPVSQQQRSRLSRRQSSKPSSGSNRRLVG